MKTLKVQEFCQDNGFTSRKQRYEIMAEYFGISQATLKEIVSFDRQLRDVFPVDEKGIELEKEYHMPDYILSEQNNLFKVRPITQ